MQRLQENTCTSASTSYEQIDNQTANGQELYKQLALGFSNSQKLCEQVE